MLRLLPFVIAATAILYIFLLPELPMFITLFFKVLPMILIILYSFFNLPKQRSFIHYSIIIGLMFSAFGDITLHWFVIGLTAFLIAHIFYSIGFFTQWRSSFIRMFSIIPIVIYSYIIGNGILKSMTDHTLMIPVASYIIVISIMAWSAIMTRNVYASVGAVLFVLSDSILAWNMFVTAIPHSGTFIMLFYYGAQFLLAYSVKYFK